MVRNEILCTLHATCLILLCCSSFQKSKKDKARIEISEPSDFEHRVHTGYDGKSGQYVGLPKQWSSIISTPEEKRPKPIIDASRITDTEVTSLKVSRYLHLTRNPFTLKFTTHPHSFSFIAHYEGSHESER